MKKFLLLAIFVVMPMVTMAAPECNSYTTVSYVGNQNPEDDEFLYKNENDWNLTKQGFINSGRKNSGAGLAYECDAGQNVSGCKPQSVVTMWPGHIFKGQVINKEQKYQCKNIVGLNNKWVVVEDGICHTNGFGDVAVGDCVPDAGGGCRTLTNVDCSGYRLSDPSGIEFKGVCVEGPEFFCLATKCREGLAPDANGVCKSGMVDNKEPVDPVKPVKPVNPVVGKCHPSVCTSEVCKACCAKPGTETIWTPSVNECVCVNGGDFVKENNEWACKTKTVVVTEPEKYICDAMLLANVVSWKNRCVNFADVLTQISALEAYCAAVPDKDVFLRLYDELKVVVDTTCVDEPEKDNTVIVIGFGTAQSKISESVSVLQTLTSDLDVKKWRDAQGKFNTARLASDSIAGVVLGTAGGLITSHVVKKNQIEDGFEDLNCSIGGQTVAGWSDEFNVGIQ